MLALYTVGIGVAWWVHPSRRKAKEARKAKQADKTSG
jgi:Sec-independent protein secretion pathway component TatC